MVAMSLSTPALAERALAGRVSGSVIDAVGGALTDVRVELWQASAGRPVGFPLHVTSTDAGGGWSFRTVAPGEYVVQIRLNDQLTGLPVLIDEGSLLTGLQIVAPSATAAVLAPPPPGGGGGVPLWVIGVAAAGATAATVGLVLRDKS